jgi:hypothetical protein
VKPTKIVLNGVSHNRQKTLNVACEQYYENTYPYKAQVTVSHILPSHGLYILVVMTHTFKALILAIFNGSSDSARNISCSKFSSCASISLNLFTINSITL